MRHLTSLFRQSPRVSSAHELFRNTKKSWYQEIGSISSRKQKLDWRKRHPRHLNDTLVQVELLKDHTRAIYAAKDMHNPRGSDDITERSTTPVRAYTATLNGVAPTSIGLTSRGSTTMSSPTWHRTWRRGHATGSQIPGYVCDSSPRRNWLRLR